MRWRCWLTQPPSQQQPKSINSLTKVIEIDDATLPPPSTNQHDIIDLMDDDNDSFGTISLSDPDFEGIHIWEDLINMPDKEQEAKKAQAQIHVDFAGPDLDDPLLLFD